MALKYYDESLTEKIKGWVQNTPLVVTSPGETRRLFEYLADTQNDSTIKLPIIALRRNTSFEILSTAKRPLTFDGATLDATKQKSTQLNAIPVSLSYQLDVYTRYFDECDEYIRNLIFYIINYPKLHLSISYNGTTIEHDSNIRIVSTVTDNSDIPERMIPGQFTRFTIQLTVDDAYLWSIPVRSNFEVESDVSVYLEKEIKES